MTKGIVIILILLIALVFIIWAFVTPSRISEKEGYTNFDSANRFTNIKQLSGQPSSAVEEDVARLDRDYFVVFPVNTEIQNYAKRFFGGSLAVNWNTPEAINATWEGQWGKNMGMPLPVLLNLWPICNIRENSAFYFPLLFTGDTVNAGKGSQAQYITLDPQNNPGGPNFLQTSLSKGVNNFYSKYFGSPAKNHGTFFTRWGIVGDVYPLSSWDHDDTINPYDSGEALAGRKFASARVRDRLRIEYLTYGTFPELGPLRIEVNKCSPIPLHSWVSNKTVNEMGVDESIHRIYSHPDVNNSKDTGAPYGQYIPSRFREEYALLKPKLSSLNMLFSTNKGVVSGSYTGKSLTPRYSNVDGVQGADIPACSTFYDLNSVWRTKTTLFSSQSFELPSGTAYISGISPTLLLNPYLPVQKSGSGTAISEYIDRTDTAVRTDWYNKAVRGRTRIIAQSRMCSNTGSIAYVFDSGGHILWAEPIRFFNLQRNLGDWGGVYPTEFSYYNKKGVLEKDNRPPISLGNVREATSSQSFPLIAPFSQLRDYVTLDNPLLNSVKMTFGQSSAGSSSEMLMAARSVNNVFLDLPSSIISEDVAKFGQTGFVGAVTPLIDNLRASNESVASSKIWKYPIGGFEFLNVSDTKFDLLGAKFEDFTGRKFDLSALGVGSKHTAISKDVALTGNQYQNFIINAYTHNYYFPWVSNHRTKYLVIENCTANTRCMVSLNLKVTKYTSSAMDPESVVDIAPDEMFCYYSGCAYDKEYDYSAAKEARNGLPRSKLIDYGYNYPEFNSFSGDMGQWNTYPLIGSQYIDANRNWAKDKKFIPAVAGNIAYDSYMLRAWPDASSIVHYSSVLLDHRNHTNSKTIIVVFNEPVFLNSVSFVSRTMPKNTGDKWERAATTGINLTDKDVTFRNNNYVTLYNNNAHCISSYIMNDSIPTTRGTGLPSGAPTGVSSLYNTNVLNYATFGPTTKLERNEKFNIYPE